MRVLIVEDDPDFRDITSRALSNAGFDYHTVATGEEALAVLADPEQPAFDVVLLDVVMPGASGWDLLLEMREKGEEVPVIFVTGRESVEERVRGLRLGADDYLVKPIDFDELIARIEAVVRRRRELPDVVVGDLRIVHGKRRVLRDGKVLPLSPREYDLLVALSRGHGETVSRRQLLREVWDVDTDPGTNLLDVHIGRLRRKVDAEGEPLIETVRGQGYKLRID